MLICYFRFSTIACWGYLKFAEPCSNRGQSDSSTRSNLILHLQAVLIIESAILLELNSNVLLRIYVNPTIALNVLVLSYVCCINSKWLVITLQNRIFRLPCQAGTISTLKTRFIDGDDYHIIPHKLSQEPANPNSLFI